MMIGGLIVYFFIKWGVMRNLKKIPEAGFFSDQKDEMGVGLILGLSFITWDDEVLAAYYKTQPDEVPELELWMYFFVGVAGENLYQLFQVAYLVKSKVVSLLKKIKIKMD